MGVHDLYQILYNTDDDLFLGWLWWTIQGIITLLNVKMWTVIYFSPKTRLKSYSKKQMWLSFFYVIASAIRSIWPRHDVDRMCFFESWISTPFVGRSLATVGELCFISQLG